MTARDRMTAARLKACVRRVERAFDDACERLPPLAPGARLLLGCSAGGDSMALLELATRRAAARRWTLAVAHVDHAQRPESADEARFVAEQAARHGVEVFIERLDEALAAAAPLSEAVMREARHACWRRTAERWGASAVVLAHQADDRAETLLMRLLAGSGPTGLSAQRPIERLGRLTLVRPLLAVRRAELRAYLEAQGLSWRDDPTNDGTANLRGWIRNVLIPSMAARLGLDPVERLARAADLIGEESAALNDAAQALLASLTAAGEPPVLGRLNLVHPLWLHAGAPLRRQLVRQWLWGLRRSAYPPGLEAVREALKFIERGRTGAQLRSIERLHLVHARTQVLAVAPDADADARRRLARRWAGAPFDAASEGAEPHLDGAAARAAEPPIG